MSLNAGALPGALLTRLVLDKKIKGEGAAATERRCQVGELVMRTSAAYVLMDYLIFAGRHVTS